MELNDSYSAASCYQPLGGDDIDQALAEFINKEWPDRYDLAQGFQRESRGVYQCGSQKVQLKLGKGKQLLIKIGAGAPINLKEYLLASHPLVANNEDEELAPRPSHQTPNRHNKSHLIDGGRGSGKALTSQRLHNQTQGTSAHRLTNQTTSNESSEPKVPQRSSAIVLQRQRSEENI